MTTKKQLISKSNQLKADKNYQNLLQEIQSIIFKNEYTAYKAVDNIKIQTYWQIGERIVREELKHKERAEYGQFLIENLEIDLNINKRELYRFIKFYNCYPICGRTAPTIELDTLSVSC